MLSKFEEVKVACVHECQKSPASACVRMSKQYDVSSLLLFCYRLLLFAVRDWPIKSMSSISEVVNY